MYLQVSCRKLVAAKIDESMKIMHLLSYVTRKPAISNQPAQQQKLLRYLDGTDLGPIQLRPV